MLARKVHSRELALINRVAAIIDPIAFDARFDVPGRESASRIAFKVCQEHNQQIAREKAIEIIALIEGES
jgi:hypothetical protein